VSTLPLLGSGKTDYVRLKSLTEVRRNVEQGST
jgi:hypothetical protein